MYAFTACRNEDSFTEGTRPQCDCRYRGMIVRVSHLTRSFARHNMDTRISFELSFHSRVRHSPMTSRQRAGTNPLPGTQTLRIMGWTKKAMTLLMTNLHRENPFHHGQKVHWMTQIIIERIRWLSGEGVGLVIRRSLVRFPAIPNDVVFLGKALHPTCLGGSLCTYCKSLWIRASAK